jgi:hypothetical protein
MVKAGSATASLSLFAEVVIFCSVFFTVGRLDGRGTVRQRFEGGVLMLSMRLFAEVKTTLWKLVC